MFIKKTINEWNLTRYVPIKILSDNGADITSGIKESSNINLRCAAHSYNIVIKNVVKRCAGRI